MAAVSALFNIFSSSLQETKDTFEQCSKFTTFCFPGTVFNGQPVVIENTPVLKTYDL